MSEVKKDESVVEKEVKKDSKQVKWATLSVSMPVRLRLCAFGEYAGKVKGKHIMMVTNEELLETVCDLAELGLKQVQHIESK